MSSYKKSCIVAAIYAGMLIIFFIAVLNVGKFGRSYDIFLLLTGVLLIGYAIAVFVMLNIMDKELCDIKLLNTQSADIDEHCRRSISDFSKLATTKTCNLIAYMYAGKLTVSLENPITEYREMMEDRIDSVVQGVEQASHSFSFERSKILQYYIDRKKAYLQKSLNEILESSLRAIHEAQYGLRK